MTRQPKTPPANNNQPPLLTIERAIADGLCPTSLRHVADRNAKTGPRRERVAAHLYALANRLELLGYGREREVA
ncbi:hypothetical protein IB276_25985 [Ensifer sp. ENS04]|uniref:hypothetical protein n=1 Tax=Ensifer sp. ENS04 TaxID=2769281 RepID=UPI00177FD007|nr:hypothetical protein [Ensifer sp. ENS04]MBD9542900.1 hypothetical protein [Ensifer sp. ENS04]